MSNNSLTLEERMKRYESVPKHFLMRKTPCIIRLDGKAAHTFTRGFKKPFDEIFTNSMQETMKALCEEIQGCVFGYTQSDEITLVLIDYQDLTSDAWFGYNVQKMTSVSASIATYAFNTAYKNNLLVAMTEGKMARNTKEEYSLNDNKFKNYLNKHLLFDSRCFSLPVDEVVNCLIWRQIDAIRNSILATGYANFSHSYLNHKKTPEIVELLKNEANVDWFDLPIHLQRGSACYKVPVEVTTVNGNVLRNKWRVDQNIPVFSKDKDFINTHVIF